MAKTTQIDCNHKQNLSKDVNVCQMFRYSDVLRFLADIVVISKFVVEPCILKKEFLWSEHVDKMTISLKYKADLQGNFADVEMVILVSASNLFPRNTCA